MVKKTVMNVNMSCPKCKREVLKAVTKLSGIDEVIADGDKGMLTVTGVVDPVLVTENVRKTGKCVEIVSIGPPKKPDPPVPAKQVPPPPPPPPPPPCGCQLVAISYVPSYNDGFCTIL